MLWNAYLLLYVATSSRTRLLPAYELIYLHAFLLDLPVFT